MESCGGLASIVLQDAGLGASCISLFCFHNSFFHRLGSLWWGALASPRCVSYLECGTVSVKGVVVSCSLPQVTGEYCVSARGLFVASWYCAFIVEIVVGATAVSAFGDLGAGYAYISGVAELKAVLAG